MSSTASELSALGSCTVVDFYRRSLRPGQAAEPFLEFVLRSAGRRLGLPGGVALPVQFAFGVDVRL